MLSVAIIFLAAAFGASQTQNFSLVGKTMVLAIALIYFITTIYGGLISWRTDKILEELKEARPQRVLNGREKSGGISGHRDR
jgi:hypothetical protein